MARKRKTRKARSRCTTVVFKREKRGGKLLPKSEWKHVRFCR
jgi:hypothetical protein